VRNLVKLELELAKMEVGQKVKKAAVGIGLAVAGGVIALIAGFFLIAAAAAGIATAVPVWAALLIMAGATILIGGVALVFGVRLLKRTSVPVPERAIAEAKRTSEAVRS